MSYYKITVKDKGKDKKTGDIVTGLTVFKYKDKVRDKLTPGTFIEFSGLLVEIFVRIMTPNKEPIYYFELTDSHNMHLTERIDKGLIALTQKLLSSAEEVIKKYPDGLPINRVNQGDTQ